MELSKSTAITVALITLLLLPNSPHPLLILASGGILITAILTLWTKRDLPILLFPFGMQWISVATKPILTGIYNVDIQTLAERGAPLEQAAWFGLFGLAALLIGMRLGCSSGGNININSRLEAETRIYAPQYILLLALCMILLGHVFVILAPSLGGLYQPALVMGDAKYAGVFLLVYSSVKLGRYQIITVIICASEIVIGMLGFFGEFRLTLFMILLGVLLSQSRTSFKNIVLGSTAALATLTIITFWSAIKTEYRAQLNQGADRQVVSISVEERLSFLAGAATNADAELANNGLERSLSRVSYIDFLGHTMAYVPAVRPHQSGKQTSQAVTHIITPRLLYPDKPSVPHDTHVTAMYTGLNFNQSHFSSISIGYLGELYVDFGRIGALFATLLIGLFVGKIYSVIILYGKTPLFINIALSIVAVMPFIYFEQALIKLTGDAVTFCVVILAIQRFVLPRIIQMRSPNKRMRLRPIRRHELNRLK